ncbi:MAG TPA: type II toxin-antitoxin system VapB family antitoxin [Terracidiphilus sp.]|jgi:antitoxin VapB|nr:type II toxin-antitoxin system VapB family antitoxin [Terracidiphilus sp.]
MPLSIKMPEADRLARRLAETTGETISLAVLLAIRERLERVERKREEKQALIADLMAIAHHCASLPVLDTRTEDEIMGWDENGLPS